MLTTVCEAHEEFLVVLRPLIKGNSGDSFVRKEVLVEATAAEEEALAGFLLLQHGDLIHTLFIMEKPSQPVASQLFSVEEVTRAISEAQTAQLYEMRGGCPLTQPSTINRPPVFKMPCLFFINS